MVAPRASALGDYLRARREQLRPEDVGLTSGARRRVPGLRREEVATLAGISSAYYLRLEQGRDTHPSVQVVEALARALRLEPNARGYLFRLATPTGSYQPMSAMESVAATLHQLINHLSVPAVVANRYQDVLAANACARAVSPGWKPGRNFLCWLLFDPAAQRLYGNWDEAVQIAVSEFRQIAGGDMDDPRLRSLIDGLSVDSPLFRDLWARAEVGYRAGIVHLRHAQAGDLHLHRNRFNVPHSGGQDLLIYHPEPGSDSVDALDALHSASTV